MAGMTQSIRRAIRLSIPAVRDNLHRSRPLTIPKNMVLPLSGEPRTPAQCGSVFAAVKRALLGGETIVEIGCGHGLQSIEMARLAGPSGRVVSIDSSPDAISAARRNAADAGLKNITFYLCRVDSIPLPPGSADWIISEGVVCPSSGKMAVFREMFRVLAPGGRILIHDIAIRKLLPPEIADTIASVTFGLTGAIELSSYRKLLNSTGFDQCRITEAASGLHMERFCDSAAGPSAHRPGRGTAAAVLSRLSDLRWLQEYITSVRLQAQKPAIEAVCA